MCRCDDKELLVHGDRLTEVDARAEGAVELEESVQALEDSLVGQLKAFEKQEAAEAHLQSERHMLYKRLHLWTGARGKAAR